MSAALRRFIAAILMQQPMRRALQKRKTFRHVPRPHGRIELMRRQRHAILLFAAYIDSFSSAVSYDSEVPAPRRRATCVSVGRKITGR